MTQQQKRQGQAAGRGGANGGVASPTRAGGGAGGGPTSTPRQHSAGSHRSHGHGHGPSPGHTPVPLNHSKPRSATAVMTANVFSVAGHSAEGPPPPRSEASAFAPPHIATSIQRTALGKNIPGHIPTVADSSGSNSDNKGKFARLHKAPPKAFGHNL